MISSRPYLFGAFYHWIIDNEWSPYIVVDAHFPAVKVPMQYVNDGEIILNISPSALQDFQMEATHIAFMASFGGAHQSLYIPFRAIKAIYAQENGQGMIFKEEEAGAKLPDKKPDYLSLVEAGQLSDKPSGAGTQPKTPAATKKSEKKPPPHLTLVD